MKIYFMSPKRRGAARQFIYCCVSQHRDLQLKKDDLTAAMSRLSEPLKISPNDPLRELFEACKCGDLAKVRELVDASNVNARDTAGRRSTPLHFSAGKTRFPHENSQFAIFFRPVQTCSKFFKLVKTCSNSFKPVQTCSSWFKLLQTWSN